MKKRFHGPEGQRGYISRHLPTFSLNEKYLLCGTDFGDISIWNTKSASQTLEFPDAPSKENECVTTERREGHFDRTAYDRESLLLPGNFCYLIKGSESVSIQSLCVTACKTTLIAGNARGQVRVTYFFSFCH